MEKSAGAVIFYKNKKSDTIEYLLLHYQKLSSEKKRQIPGHWDFPKGHIEKGESEVQTVSREVREETGISQLTIVPGFREVIRYFFQKEGKRVFKEVVFYLAQTKTKNVQISFEHLGFKWLPFEKALTKITYKNAKEILKKANEFLVKHQLNF
ncbi:MAG: NUDIX domain-containing protein [Candidatus Portnoybacteria bacterium]|nr:NUDIX domain-containing protein [Candidatus Portnoybacteria bacterium]